MELADRLITSTLNKKTQWELGPEPASFAYARRAGTVLLRTRDQDGAAPYILELFDSKANIIECLQSWTTPDDDDPPPWNDILSRLYDAARASALDVDSVVDGLLEAVDSREPPEPGLAEQAP